MQRGTLSYSEESFDELGSGYDNKRHGRRIPLCTSINGYASWKDANQEKSKDCTPIVLGSDPGRDLKSLGVS